MFGTLSLACFVSNRFEGFKVGTELGFSDFDFTPAIWDLSVALSFHQFLGYGCLGVCHEGEGREASSGEVHEASFSFSAGR